MDENLPEGWVWTTLGELGEYINGYAFNDELWSKTGRPIIRIQDLTKTRNEPNYYDGEIEEKYLVRPGDFLIAWSATLGAFIWHGPEAWLNQHIFKVVSYVNKLFHYYLTQTFIDELYQKAHGSGMVHVTRGIFESTRVSLPPLPEQTRIVAAIEQQFTRLDNAVASLRSAKAKAKQYRASLLKSAVEGELTKEWRDSQPASETGEQLLARILAERRARWEEEQLAKMREKGKEPWNDEWKKAYKEPQEPDVEDLPDLPEGWCWATVEQVIMYLRNGLPHKPEAQLPGYRILRINAVRPMSVVLDEVRYLDLPESDVRDYFINDGDILFTRYNGSLDLLGVAGMVRNCVEPTLHPDKLIRVKTVIGEPFASYLELVCNVGVSRAFVESKARTTAGQKGISGSDIKQIPFPLPPLAEQAQIVAEVEAQLSELAKTEETIEHSLTRAEQQRQSILREAFAGRLVEQDPQDEPASVLLARIREERAKRAEIEQVRRRENKMVMTQQRKNSKQKAPLYDVLVEAGGKLTPEELYKRSEEQRKTLPESERAEGFYIALDAEVTATLIAEERPTYSTVLLRATEQAGEELEEEEQLAEVPDLQAVIPQLRELDTQPKPRVHPSKEEAHRPSLWDE